MLPPRLPRLALRALVPEEGKDGPWYEVRDTVTGESLQGPSMPRLLVFLCNVIIDEIRTSGALRQ